MEIHIYLFLTILFILLLISLLFYHAYSSIEDKTTPGDAELLSASMFCFKSAFLSLGTILVIYLFIEVEPYMRAFIIKVLLWHNILTIFLSIGVVILGLIKMRNDNPPDYENAYRFGIIGIIISIALLIAMIFYHIVYVSEKTM